jgi:hypothetical protein
MAFDAEGRGTGGQQKLTIGGKAIKVTSCTPNVTKNMADAADSGDYDPTTKMIQLKRIPISVEVSFDVEGFFRLYSTPGDILAKVVSADPVPLVYMPDGVNALMSGDFHLNDFSSDNPFDDMITWSATAEPAGPVVWGGNVAAPATPPTGP